MSHNTTPATVCSSCLRNISQNDVNSLRNHSQNDALSYNVLDLSEATPLLTTTNSTFFRSERSRLSVWEKMWLGFFLTIVIVASGIGIYLLFAEEDPPLPESFELIPKNSWVWGSYASPTLPQLRKNDPQIPPPYLTLPVSKVVLSQTNTTTCNGLYKCKTVLNGFLAQNDWEIPYNFLIDSAGRVYEGRGFLQPKCEKSERFCDDTLVIAFIGPLDSKPTFQQISSLKSFLDYSVTKYYLDRCYEIQVRMRNFSRNHYIDVAFEIQKSHRKLNKCDVYF